MNVFTYGSLMYDSVWAKVVTQTYRQKSGVVHGFQRLRVKNEKYPGLIKGNGVVEGIINFDIEAEDLARLDIFEGDLYKREAVEALDADGEKTIAFVYLIRDEFKSVLDGEWSKAEFERTGWPSLKSSMWVCAG